MVAGLMVGVASSFVYDFVGSKKEKNDSLVPQQNLGVAPTETIAKRPSLIADLVSVHALLSVLSIIWFFLNAGIQKGLDQILLVALFLLGALMSPIFVISIKALTKASPRSACIVIAIQWTLSVSLLGLLLYRGMTLFDAEKLTEAYAVFSGATVIAVGVIYLLWRWIRPAW